MRMNTVACWVGVFLVSLVGSANAQVLAAADDAYPAFEGRLLQVEALGVLENDALDGEPLPPGAEAQLIDSVVHGFTDCATDPGFTELCLDGSFEYTPDPGFVGVDTFTYQVSNGGATSNTATVTITVSGCEPVGAAGPPVVSGFRCWVEASYLSKLTELGYGSFQEGFENESVWGGAREPSAVSSVVSQGIDWTPNNGVSGVTTGTGPANSGNWGFYEAPHGETTGASTTPQRDGFMGTWNGPGALFAVGGWLTSNTGNAQARLVLDGVEVSFADSAVTGPFKFFGAIDTTGFTGFEFYESHGVVEDQEFIFGDDFTIGVSSTVIFADGFEFGGMTNWSSWAP